MSKEKRKLGDYEIIQSIYIGDKEVVFGVDKKDPYPFMVCYCDYHNPLSAAWPTEGVASDDYLEAMQIFVDRVQSQIWDNIREKYYADDYGKILTYPTEDAANEGLAAVKKAVADKEAEEWLYVERAKQGLDPVPTQDNADLIGKEITIDNRKYVVESVGRISGDVSLRDITFQNSTGFPINRVEKIGYIQSLLEQAKAELPTEEKTEAPAVLSADRHNFRITDDTLGVGGAKEKFRNNMAAINLLHELEIENRLATPEEQEILSRYVGWGGLSMVFDEHNAAWADEFKELYASLSPEEYNAAMESTLTAFYTPPVVIKAMYEALDRLGFSQGNILEPSCGTGNFFGLLPESMAGSKLHGVELDPLTGKIAKQLYQKANIAIEGFEKTKLPDDHFDVVIGNVPFGEIRVNDSRYNAQKFLIHDYFFAKALDKVRAGGVVMFITSKGTMDKASPEVRKYSRLGDFQFRQAFLSAYAGNRYIP